MKKSEILSLLNYWLHPKAKIYKDFKKHILGTDKTTRIFIDRGSDVLFMAHIDTVHPPQLKKHKDNRIWAAGLDDRLGCALANKFSQEWEADLLLCDFEEEARSSGQYHGLKDYNWIAEFDRNGGDVVTYDLENDEFIAGLRKYFNVGWGTFSDLCLLTTKACCVNIGIGYKFDHSVNSFVDLNVLNCQLINFKGFFDEYKTVKFIQDPEKMKYNIYKDAFYDYGNSDVYENYRECDFCGNIGAEEIFGSRICQECFESLTNDYLYSSWAKNEYT